MFNEALITNPDIAYWLIFTYIYIYIYIWLGLSRLHADFSRMLVRINAVIQLFCIKSSPQVYINTHNDSYNKLAVNIFNMFEYTFKLNIDISMLPLLVSGEINVKLDADLADDNRDYYSQLDNGRHLESK